MFATYPSHTPYRSSTPSSVFSEDESSMASTTGVPPLTRGNSMISSDSAAETDDASGVMGEGFYLEEREGALTLPDRFQPDARLICPFQILDCERVSPDLRSFKSHVFSHFKGQVLPTSASCFLCDRTFTQTAADDGALSWNEMLSHLVHDHYRQGEQLAVVRPEFKLMRWMFSRRLISEHQLKRAQLKPVPMFIASARNGMGDIISAPLAPMPPSAAQSRSAHATILANMRLPIQSRNESYTMSAGIRADRRQRDATRHLIIS